MMTLELDQHPELAALVAAIRQGEAVAVVDHGRPVMRCVPPPMALRDQLMALHRRFTSPAHPDSEVKSEGITVHTDKS